jgi:probable phosphoglycerate mutase
MTTDLHRPEVVLLRHGETEWSRSGQHTGRTDVSLTELGCRQAEAIASQVEGRTFARVLTSPLERATTTCELAGLAEQAELCPDLMEWDYGAYEGRTTPEIRTEVPGWSIWRDGPEGGETAAEVGRRADRVIGAIRRGDGDAVLISHGHILRVLAARWLGLAPVDGRLFALDTATVSTLGWEREVAVIQRWNDASHLKDLKA